MRGERIRKVYLKVMSLLLILATGLLCAPISAYAQESEAQTVRVAYFDMGEYYEEITDGTVRSYDTEMLTKIEAYTNLHFVYINCGTWSNALTMLKNHEVDLVGTVQWNQEREDTYEFCLENYGYTVGELVSLAGNEFVYEDYAAIGNAAIGTTRDYVRRADIDAVFEEHGIAPTFQTYAGQAELEHALESGEVDLIAANSHTLKSDWSVVEKFSYAPFYFISWKGNERLTDQIDDALIAINLREPQFDDDLLTKYFPSIVGAPLTKEELDLIAEGNTYNVYLNANTKPTAWYDEKSGAMKGTLVDVCRQICEITGLKLNIVPIGDGAGEMDDTSIKTTTIISGVQQGAGEQSGVSDALVIDAFNFYYCGNRQVNMSEGGFTVAVMENRQALKDYIAEMYENVSFTEYTSPAECLRAVSEGAADVTYLNCRIAENAILESGIEDMREFPSASEQQGIALVFPGENGEMLASIVNKGLEKVDQDEITRLFVQYALETQEPLTFSKLIRDNTGLVIAVAATFLLVLVAVAVLFTYARVMKRQKNRVMKADADRTEFFSRMSHDMRTPMNGILGMIRLSKDSEDIAQVHENLNKAESAGEYMLSLINDTLDLQRMESDKMKLEYSVVPTREYYDNIFSILKVSAEVKQLDFRVKYIDIDLDNYLEIDATRLKQVLSNLISNAIKFTPEGGTVEVTVESLGQDGNILHRKYTVRDTGVGMSEAFIKNRLFTPYSQENNELSSQLTGSGLGMAISKNLIELMGGRLEVESALGEGTTYAAYLDIKRASKESIEKLIAEREERKRMVLANLAGKKILLFEDHPLNAEIAQRLLKKAGCSVEWAENGEIGVACFTKAPAHTFDAILMDLRMPVMDGLEAARTIRAMERPDAKTIPILAMTANAYESDIQRCMAAGMNAHIAKPIEPAVLYSTLYEYICTAKADTDEQAH